jgi:hypothetical protein
MRFARLTAWLGLGCIAALAIGPAAQAGDRRAVIELFTSQGCSSCPSADRLIGELAQDRSLVALSLPIDYWDYLGWKDTLALAGHTKRQYGYAKSRGDRQVYTPQAVVNGVVHVLGSDRSAIERAITQTRSDATTMQVPVTMSVASGDISISVAESMARPADVWLCGVKRAAAIRIARGENRGRTVTYHNVVRSWHKLGDLSGKPASWTVSLSSLKGSSDEAAVIVQERPNGYPGRVLGAAIIAVR